MRSTPRIPTSTVGDGRASIDARRPARTRRYVWAGEWRNPQGDLASYVFKYVIPESGGEALSRMQVYSNVMEAEAERRVEARVKQQTGRQGSPHTGLPKGFPEEAGAHGPRTPAPATASLPRNQLGDAVVQVTGADGPLVSYRWRARRRPTARRRRVRCRLVDDRGRTAELVVDAASRRADARGRRLLRRADGPDPLPAAEFDIDLAAVRRLAALTPERDEQYRRFVLPPSRLRTIARPPRVFRKDDAGPLWAGVPRLGGQGRGVVVIEKANLNSVAYRWRHRARSRAGRRPERRRATETPFPSIHVGPSRCSGR